MTLESLENNIFCETVGCLDTNCPGLEVLDFRFHESKLSPFKDHLKCLESFNSVEGYPPGN